MKTKTLEDQANSNLAIIRMIGVHPRRHDAARNWLKRHYMELPDSWRFTGWKPERDWTIKDYGDALLRVTALTLTPFSEQFLILAAEWERDRINNPENGAKKLSAFFNGWDFRFQKDEVLRIALCRMRFYLNNSAIRKAEGREE